MDQELKQRLIGAAVVTALAAIFIPMLFDDPVDDSGRKVSELTIPKPPTIVSNDAANQLPASAADVISGTQDTGSEETLSDSEGSDNSLPLQPSEKIEQDEAVIEETAEPNDEQQWIEESAGGEEPLQAAEDSADALEPQQTASDDGAVEPALSPDEQSRSERSGKMKVTEKQKPIETDTGTVKSSQKKASSSLSPTAPQTAVKKTKTDESNSKARLVRWYVQAGSFGKKENALSRQEALRKQGFPVFVETQSTDKGAFYRLKIGPELDKKRAIAIRNRLNKQNIKTIILAE